MEIRVGAPALEQELEQEQERAGQHREDRHDRCLHHGATTFLMRGWPAGHWLSSQ
ncbi:hypothetical protein AB0M36_09665 [Actinoplanes sp. NPDC051346]|uniref:hypothetical protein n=1 Tax=Actinoplanes sp. NPDC051346 TaxID=3155048 RepID=UPI00342D8798